MEIIFLSAAPCIFLIIFNYVIRYSRANKRSPFTENLMRRPGESLIAKLDDYFMDSIMIIIIAALVPAYVYIGLIKYYQNVMNQHYHLFFGIFLVFEFICAVKLCYIFKKMLSYNFGYEGERVTAEGLSKALNDKFFIYHDLVFNKATVTFNIDHVVVAPSGIYLIETKARKKITAMKEGHIVKFDGEKLTFPTWTEKEVILQVTNLVKAFTEWLEKAMGQPIPVKPIICLPGWFIDFPPEYAKQTDKKILIFNEKQLYFIKKQKDVLTNKQIQTICHQIEQKWRDIKPKN